jgi:DHA2 family multidrug resistance protein-like MFS transporter
MTTLLAAAPDEPTFGLHGTRRAVAIACVLAAMVLVVLDAAMANLALPTIARSLEVSPAESVRVVTAYQMALVMALLPCAALGESLGCRRVFTTGAALFTAGAACSALAPSLPWLVAARLLQGLGGAAVMALGVALLRSVVQPRELGAAVGWNALAVALSTAAGPTVAALILSGASYRWLFAVTLPLGLAVLLAARSLPAIAGTAHRVDKVSVALNAATFALLVMGASLLPARPMAAAVALAASAVAVAALIRRELPRPAPLIPLDLLRTGSFRISMIASVCCFAGQTSGLVALPFFLQHGLGQDASMTGLLMTPWPLTVAIMGPIAGRLASRVSTALLCAAGGACLAIGLAGAALSPLDQGTLPLVLCVTLCGLGFGLFQVPNNRSMFLAAPRERSAAAGGLQGTARLLGQTAGAVLMALLLAVSPLDTAPRIGLGLGALLCLAAGLVSTLRATRSEQPCPASFRTATPSWTCIRSVASQPSKKWRKPSASSPDLPRATSTGETANKAGGLGI